MMETKEEWEQAREIEKYLNDYDQEVIVRRKIAESKHFYLFKEAKKRRLGSRLIYFHGNAYNGPFFEKGCFP